MLLHQLFTPLKRPLFLIALILTLASEVFCAIPPVPNPPKLVNDFCQLLNSEEIYQLENELLAYNDSTSTQIAIVVVCELEGMDVADYGTRLFEQWKIGQQGKDNGILVLIAKNERKMNITTGYGVEDKLTDALCRRIIERDIKPSFKAGNFALGLSSGIRSIKEVLLGQYKPDKKQNRSTLRLPKGSFLILVVVLLYLILKFGGKSGGGGRGFGSGGRYHYRPPVFFGGGSSFGGGGFGGGGFGGFGGGSTGGGGASGSW